MYINSEGQTTENGHRWRLDKEGYIDVIYTDNYPYCTLIVCKECFEIYCQGGCDGDWENAVCDSELQPQLPFEDM